MTVALTYDIDAIMAGSDSSAKVLHRLWETLGTTAREALISVERVLMDAWTFDSTMGNGLCDLIANENFDSIANGLRALRDLGRPRLDQFVSEVAMTFEAHGIDVTTGNSIAHLRDLPADQRATLESALKGCEKPFLDEIWIDGIIIGAANDYLNQNLELLRERRAEQVSGGNGDATRLP